MLVQLKNLGNLSVQCTLGYNSPQDKHNLHGGIDFHKNFIQTCDFTDFLNLWFYLQILKYSDCNLLKTANSATLLLNLNFSDVPELKYLTLY